ncbi:hypothetical protein [Botrimarina sp.]|uniref:hypothetical protein n=1 Tax=Botrimarina sp. TaxID=2795802 RepID=UPI0032EFAAE6
MNPFDSSPVVARPFLIAWLLAIGAAAAAQPVRPGDRVLLVSTRPVGCTTDAATLAAGVQAAEYDACSWRTTGFDPLVASLDPSAPLIVYVHGNQIAPHDARRRGLQVYRSLVRCASDERPLQFVIFSWNSTKVPGLLRDYRVKAERTKPVAWQLAWVIGRFPEGARVGMLGYSYGARVTSGAAHLLAGGSLDCLRYEGEGCLPCRLASVRGVFLAAAYDACWNSRRSYHGRALDTLDDLLVTTNPRDPAMRFYDLLRRGTDPDATGERGPRGLDSEQASRVCLWNASRSVGRSHDLEEYLCVPGLMQAAWRRLAFADQPAAATQPTLASATQPTLATRQ